MHENFDLGRLALQQLVEARKSALQLSDQTIVRLTAISLGQFKRALESANSQRQRLAIGLVWAGRLVDASTSPRTLDDALFRFAQHLRASASSSATPREHRRVLERAAYVAANRLRNTPTELRQSSNEPPTTRDDGRWWSEALGVEVGLWTSLIDSVGTATKTVRPRAVAEKAERPVPLPSWLSLPPAERASARLAELASWRVSDPPEDGVAAPEEDIARAYQAFATGDFLKALELAASTQQTMGRLWAPTETSEGRAFFAWIRALPLLELIARPDGSASSHHILSALELLHRAHSPEALIHEEWLRGLIPAEPSGDHAADVDWAIIRYRLCRVLGHEVALEDIANPVKARLRSLWKLAFSTLSFADDSTIGYVSVLGGPLGDALTELGQHRLEKLVAAQRSLKTLDDYCTVSEREALVLVIRAASNYVTSLSGGDSMQSLVDVQSAVIDASDEIRLSGSVLLQEACLPLLSKIRFDTSERMAQLNAAGGPVVSVELLTDRLPLLCDVGTQAELVFRVQNEGTMVARDVRLSLEGCPELHATVDGVSVGDVPAGAERTCIIQAATVQVVRETTILVQAVWTDDYDREFETVERFHAEAQRESRWLSGDRNPFQLSSIEDPERLIGRTEYIETFLNAARSGASMYVTGLKRVGKTSLVRVALKLLEREGAIAVYLPLGRALGPSPRAADLVEAMLEKLHETACDAFPALEIPPLERTNEPAAFPRAADRWLGKLRRVLPTGSRAMIALDDFDELPVGLRSGDEGDALFLFLRSLVDEEWLSLTFIGSEVLPTLLSQQSQRLNQVDPVQVENFGSREETGDLLRKPSIDRIDWTEESIDAVHAMTSGNPYYATILGARIWSRLRERGRTLAQASDAETAAETVASTENPSHFMHLWSDDPEGLDAASARAIRSSAVLRSVARCSTTSGAMVDRGEVVYVAQQWIPAATTELLQESCSSLVRRGILDEVESGKVRLRIPVVGRWLVGSGGRHLDEVYRESSLARPASRVVTAADYVQLARNVSYQGRTLSALDLQGWVEQLPDQSHRYLAFQLLRRVCTEGFYSQERVQAEVVPRLTEALRKGPLVGRESRTSNNYLTNVLVLEHGPTGGSATGIIRQLLASLRITKSSVTSLAQVRERVGSERPALILVLDEFSGSGSQIGRVVDSLVQELDKYSASWRDVTAIGVGLGVVAGPEPEAELKSRPCDVAVGKRLGLEVRAFEHGARIFESESDREAARDLFAAIGRGLGASQPLGFAEQGLLVTFESNCPNNSLPALWKNGQYGGRPWLPIFERMETKDRSSSRKA